MFKRKYSITVLDENWHKIREDLKLTAIPRQGELLYFGDEKYLRVAEVIHYLIDRKQGVFLIVSDYSGPILSENNINFA